MAVRAVFRLHAQEKSGSTRDHQQDHADANGDESAHDHSHGGHQHDEHLHHGHGHSHAPKDVGRAFFFGVILNASFVIAEVVYGILVRNTR